MTEADAIADFFQQVQGHIASLLEMRGANKVYLARALGLSKSRISQIFGTHPNLTLETVARIYFALGERPRLLTEPKPILEDW